MYYLSSTILAIGFVMDTAKLVQLLCCVIRVRSHVYCMIKHMLREIMESMENIEASKNNMFYRKTILYSTIIESLLSKLAPYTYQSIVACRNHANILWVIIHG